MMSREGELHTEGSSSVGSAGDGGSSHEVSNHGLPSLQRGNFPFRCQISSCCGRPRSFDSGTCLVELNPGDTSSDCYLNSSLCRGRRPSLKYVQSQPHQSLYRRSYKLVISSICWLRR
ncbi:unnamed protein product [Urochloa humidicola]